MANHPTNIRFINPSTLATPPGYTHVVEVRKLAREEFLIEVEAVAHLPE